MLRQCRNYNETFNVSPSVVKRGFGIFCSRECRVQFNRTDLICNYCGQRFLRRTRTIRSGKVFCSSECRNRFFRSSKYAGVYKNYRLYIATNGYVKIVLGRSKEKLFHVYLMEEAGGGSIPKGYNVHHKNGNKLDNRLENLQLMAAGEHTTLHQLSSSEKRLIASGGIPGIHKRCPECDSVKELKDFPRSRQTRDGLYSYCRTCSVKRIQRYRKEHPRCQ